jgi:hypothetical protein
MKRWNTKRSVDERRSWFVMGTHDDNLGSDHEMLDGLARCWDVYLAHGRNLLLELGDRVVVAPELADGFGVADLVIGRTLVDVKLGIEPTADDVRQWVRQLLGYVLLDRHDTFRLEVVAVYCGWHARLLTYPLPALLAAASPGLAPALTTLRNDFHTALSDDLDGYAACKERQRY